LIGTQDGNFPDMGEHGAGEMGGLWLHTIKLLDGFWATVTDMATNQEIALSESAEFVNYPYGNRFRYGPVLDSLEIERFQFSPDSREGLIVQYSFKNAAARKRQLRFHLSVKTDLRPVWLSDRLGIKDAQDTVAWQPTDSIFIAQDGENQWFSVWGATPTYGDQAIPHQQQVHHMGMVANQASRHYMYVVQAHK